MTNPNRLTVWKGPTGRTLTPGTKFKVRGRRGEWIFMSYVTPPPPAAPHVEARSTRSSNTRVIDPDLIYEVSIRQDQGTG